MNQEFQENDRIRASWSEDVRLRDGSKVYVSTAIETTALSTSVMREVKRLTELMAETHMTNIEAAKSEETK